jgi:NAD-dependent dihydropyrimidine dehydrogenase PreA subunit
MKRTIIKIDEEKCNGCGLCVNGCHEGALQLIDGKASMISELYCDGLGACIGDCPEGAISLEDREAEPYSEIATIERISKKGVSTILAHINHLLDHNENDYACQAINYLKNNNIKIDESKLKLKSNINMNQEHQHHSGCPGSKIIDFSEKDQITTNNSPNADISSQLRQWPVQLHLVNPMASYFKGTDILLAADCVAFAMGNFHQDYLKGRSLAIACPKLDSNKEVYIEKLTAMIDESKINTLTIMMMEVPCCGGLLQMARMATEAAKRKVPVKTIYVGLQGNILSEEWV